MARSETDTKYRHVAADLRARIEQGEYPVGSAIPGRDKLKAQYGVAQATIDTALDQLKELGLVEAVQGIGTFVRSAEVVEVPDEPSLKDQVREIGRELKQLRERMDQYEQQRAEGT